LYLKNKDISLRKPMEILDFFKVLTLIITFYYLFDISHVTRNKSRGAWDETYIGLLNL